MLRRIITSVPNALTCMNLLCGALACIFAFSAFDRFGAFRGEQIVWMLIGGAAFFDFFDGAAARMLHAPSPLGKELDSLSDLVSFGMAPAMLLYNILVDWSNSVWIPYISLIIPVMGALRARAPFSRGFRFRPTQYSGSALLHGWAAMPMWAIC